MSFIAKGDNNCYNVHISSEKDLYCSYNLQHSLLAKERSIADQLHNAAIKMSMIESNHMDSIKFHGTTQHKNPTENTNCFHEISQHHTKRKLYSLLIIMELLCN